MKRVIKFLHPGPEHGPDMRGGNRKEWNAAELHRRKFLRAHGEWSRGDPQLPLKGELTFWGEWEPPSSVEAFDGPIAKGFPKWCHTPDMGSLEVTSGSGKLLQNTDPLVLGESFLYCLCQQQRANCHETALMKLNCGDLILFGSSVAGHFALDTAFVIGEHQYIRADTPLPDWSSPLHQLITVSRIPSIYLERGLRFYRGKSWSSGPPYSFVPCLPIKGSVNGFARPTINPKGAPKGSFNPKQTQGFEIVDNLNDKQLLDIWEDVANQVLRQGCMLATKINEPDGLDANINCTVAAKHVEQT